MKNCDPYPSVHLVTFTAMKLFTLLFDLYGADTPQNRYKPVVNGSHNNPTFDDIWTHTEGRTFNGE
jgi:hypothetical protein